MNPSPQTEKVFLETSVQYKRLFGLNQETDDINTFVDGKIMYCSTFVLQEFRRLYIMPLIELYFGFYNLKGAFNPREVFRQFRHVYSHKSRRLQVGLEVATEIACSGGLPRSKGKALSRIVKMVREAELKFFEGIDKQFFLQQTSCSIGTVTLNNTGNDFDDLESFYNSLKTCSGGCCRIWFLGKKHKPKFVTIAGSDVNRFHSTSYDSKKRKEFFETLMPLYQKIAEGEVVTMSEFSNLLGDTVIALESPITCTLMTYDRIFTILCELMGKEHHLLLVPSIKDMAKNFQPE